MAKGRVYPHILIDALPHLRRKLDAFVPEREALPLLLAARPVNSFMHGGGLPARAASPVGPGAEARPYPLWGEESRTGVFFPVRLVQAMLAAPGARILHLSQEGRERVEEARTDLANLLEEARLYFGLGRGEKLRIACAGGRDALYQDAWLAGPLYPSEQAYLDKVDCRSYAINLAEALRGLGNLQFEWLAESFPEAARALDRTAGRRPPMRYLWIARLARSAAAPAPEGVSGTLPCVYFKTARSWRRYDGPGLSTPGLIRRFVAEAPWGARRKVLTLPTTACAARVNPLDNPIVSTKDLELSGMAGIEAVLMDRKLGIFDDQLPDPHDPLAKSLSPAPKPPPPLYRL